MKILSRIFLFGLLYVILLASNLNAKVIFVGIQGGVDMFLGDGYTESYIPGSYQYDEGMTVEEIAAEPDGTGIDALAVYLERKFDECNLQEEYTPLIFRHSVDASGVAYWIKKIYLPGDKVFLVGYSAGGGVALKTARLLHKENIDISIMGLIDKFAPESDTIKQNVKNVYAYYQKDVLPYGEYKFNIIDKSQTAITTYLIQNTSHRSIDNNRLAWQTLGIHMKRNVSCLPPPVEEDNDDPSLGDQSNGGTSGTSTQPTDPPTSGKRPDFITSKVTMGNKDGKHEKYTWKINETAYVHDYIDNIGTADWWGSKDSIKVSFYLSKGSKEDSHSEWVRIGDRQNIKKENLKVNKKPKHEYIKFNLQDYANNGTVMPGRTYNFVVCADHPKDHNNNGGDVEEKHESNNCSTEAVFYVDYGPARNVDMMASNLALAGGKSSLQAGEAYGFQADISNIGTEYPWNGCRTNYEIKGPGTGGVWQKVADEGSTVSQLGPNSTHVEVIDESRGLKAPAVGGDYVFRACADYEQAIPETDESNNCTAELPVTVEAPLPPAVTPRIVITNPTHDDDWRSDETDHDVRWDYFDFPAQGHVKVEYSLDGGVTWLLIDDDTTNDGKKHWEDMCDFYTIDTHHAYIRVTSLEYPEATDMSDEFSIDHAKECK